MDSYEYFNYDPELLPKSNFYHSSFYYNYKSRFNANTSNLTIYMSQQSSTLNSPPLSQWVSSSSLSQSEVFPSYSPLPSEPSLPPDLPSLSELLSLSSSLTSSELSSPPNSRSSKLSSPSSSPSQASPLQASQENLQPESAFSAQLLKPLYPRSPYFGGLCVRAYSFGVRELLNLSDGVL